MSRRGAIGFLPIVGLIGAGAATAALISYCSWNSHINGRIEASGRAECPHDWSQYVTSKNDDNQSLATYATAFGSGALLSDPITDIPEYHDCQRFIMQNGTYGPLVAIFAAFKLDSLAELRDSIAPERTLLAGTPGLVPGSAIVSVSEPLAFAQVFNQESVGYAPLGIRPGFSCLYLYHVNGRFPEARMVPNGMNPACPTFDAKDTTIGTRLLVRERRTPELTGVSDYPPVARWDWSSPDSVQHIGIKCGEKVWCDIGRPRFTPSQADLEPSSSATGEGRVRRIKGWYDEQYLDVIATGSNTLVPTRTNGTVIPHPNLSTYDWEHYEANAWVLTGYIAVDDTLSYYKTKFGLDAVAPGSDFTRMNTLELCYGTRAKCDIPAKNALPGNTCGTANWIWSAIFSRWWARFQGANQLGTNTYTYKCVIRREHPHPDNPDESLGVPGTARWRWLASDPTVWEDCIRGCCEVEEK